MSVQCLPYQLLPTNCTTSKSTLNFNLFNRDPASITSETISSLKAAYYIGNGAFIVAWLIASAFTKGQISDMEIEPLDDEHEMNSYGQV